MDAFPHLIATLDDAHTAIHTALGLEYWDEHPEFPVRQWQSEETRLGYWQWVARLLVDPLVPDHVIPPEQDPCS